MSGRPDNKFSTCATGRQLLLACVISGGQSILILFFFLLLIFPIRRSIGELKDLLLLFLFEILAAFQISEYRELNALGL